MTKTISEIYGLKGPVSFVPFSKLKPVDDCSYPNLFAGLEIETERCTSEIVYREKLSGLWDIKEDGSLRGRAFEFISRPSEIRILIPELAEFFVKTGFTDQNYTDRCSIHVHTNVLNMTPKQVATLCLVYSVVEDLLFEFVNHYGVEDPRGKYRDTNIYCVPWSQCRMNHNMVAQMLGDVDSTVRKWQKYTALNVLPISSIGTVEWRHLHGTASVEKITKWLNIIGSIVKYATTRPFDEVVRTIRQLNDNSAYRQFYTDVIGPYLPYAEKYDEPLSIGVVNAKYALIGLNDKKVVEKATTAAVRAGAPMFEGLNMEAFVERAPRRPAAVQAEMAAARQRIGDRYAELIQAGREQAPRGPFYPILRGLINTPEGDAWGAKDALGRVFKSNGDLAPVGTTFRKPVVDATGAEMTTYIEGLGASYWRVTDQNYRPPVVAGAGAAMNGWNAVMDDGVENQVDEGEDL